MTDHNDLIERLEKDATRRNFLYGALNGSGKIDPVAAFLTEAATALRDLQNERDQWKTLAKKGTEIASRYLRERDEALKALEPFATTPYATIQGDAAMGICTGITLGDIRRARDVREKVK